MFTAIVRLASPRLRAVVVLVSMCSAILVGLASTPASAAPTPTYVVAGDLQNDTVNNAYWGFVDGMGGGPGFFSELRAAITNGNDFGPGKRVNATFTIRRTPVGDLLSPGALDGVDVYFSSARQIDTAEAAAMRAFVMRGGALILNSNAPTFLDDSTAAGFPLSPRVVFGDGPAPYLATHRATRVMSASPASVIEATTHPIANGPFGIVTSFNNWHSVAGFTSVPAEATVIARTTLTGPYENGSTTDITITDVATMAAVPAGAWGSGSGPVIANSDLDNFSNAYTTAGVYTDASDSACTLTGTSNGVLARNSFAWIAAQLGGATAPPVTPPVVAEGYQSLANPVRALDTRAGASALGAGEQRSVPLAAAGVPSNATMVAVNLTAVAPTATGYLMAWPTGTPAPTVSDVNFTAGTTVANAAMVKLGANRSIDLYNSGGRTDVLVDVVGYTAPGGALLTTQSPQRIKDTRSGLGGFSKAGANDIQSLTVKGNGGVPSTATAVVLNVTASDATATGYVTAWPSDQSRPAVSSINTRVDAAVPNLVIVRLPPNGVINLYNDAGNTNLIVDVLGYFTTAGSTGRLVAVDPYRLLDTRPIGAPLGERATRTITPAIAGATAVVVNITAVDPTATGYLTVYPAGGARPESSNVNFTAGKVSPNLVVVRLGADGGFTVFNSAGSTQLLVDVVGYVV
jgi:hypothetical protein